MKELICLPGYSYSLRAYMYYEISNGNMETSRGSIPAQWSSIADNTVHTTIRE